MLATVLKVLGIGVPVRIVVDRRHVVGQRSSDGDFDAFECVHDQQSQSPVEDVEVKDVIEFRVFTEYVVGLSPLERDCVGREAVVADMAQISLDAVQVRDLQAAVRKMVTELAEAPWRLDVVERTTRTDFSRWPW